MTGIMWKPWKVRRNGSSWIEWTLSQPLWVLEKMINWINIKLSGHYDRALWDVVCRGRLKENGGLSFYPWHRTGNTWLSTIRVEMEIRGWSEKMSYITICDSFLLISIRQSWQWRIRRFGKDMQHVNLRGRCWIWFESRSIWGK